MTWTGRALGLRRAFARIAAVQVVLICWLMLAAAAQADVTVTVGSSCSLAHAVDYANGMVESGCSSAAPSGTTTIMVPSGNYMLTSTLDLEANIAIEGTGASQPVISGGGNVRVFWISSSAQVTLSDLTITHGMSPAPAACTGACSPQSGGNGGGILNGGNLTLEGSLVTLNVAADGRAGAAGVALCTSGCPPVQGQNGGDGGNGGGLANFGVLKVVNSEITDNAAGNGSAATDGVSGTGSDISAGQNGGDGGVGGAGGGIYSGAGATATIEDSNIAGNAAGHGGAGGSGSTATENNQNGGNGGLGGDGGAGGGIASAGTLSISGATVASNQPGAGAAGGAGGAGLGSGSSKLHAAGGPGGNGGGVAALGASTLDTTTLTNDTITANSTLGGGQGLLIDATPGQGAGIFQGAPTAAMMVSFTTVAANDDYGSEVSDGSGIAATGGGGVTESGSIISGNGSGTDGNCFGGVSNAGGNVAYEAGASGGCPGLVGDPKLGTFASYGGPTQTLPLGSGSAAIGAVPLAACSQTQDQRGVGRPQGGHCDAGAYQYAPPSISAAAASDTGEITATVDPNLQATTVALNYGTSTGYGSTVAAISVGSSNAGQAVVFDLPALQPGATYHAQLVATNRDGTTSSSDLTFTTPAPASSTQGSTTGSSTQGTSAGASTEGGSANSGPLLLRLLKLTTRSSTLRLGLHCGGGTSGSSCTAGILLSVREKVRSGRVLVRERHGRTRVKTLILGRASVALVTGSTKSASVRLNALGRRMLNAAHRLKVKVTITGTTSIGRQATFKLAKKRARVALSARL